VTLPAAELGQGRHEQGESAEVELGDLVGADGQAGRARRHQVVADQVEEGPGDADGEVTGRLGLAAKRTGRGQGEGAAGAGPEPERSEVRRGEFEPFAGLFEVNVMGSIAYKLARVAAGQADATWSRGPKYEWDICAGTLLVLEAGGVCVDLDGRPIRFNKSFPKVNGIIADNGLLHEGILRAVTEQGAARVDKR